MNYLTTVAVVLFASSVCSEITWRQIYPPQQNVVLTNSTCFPNKKYIDDLKLQFKPINRTTSLIALDIYFRPNVSLGSPLYVQFTANKKFDTMYKPYQVNIKHELCEFLKYKNHPVFKAIAEIFARSGSNLLEPCPLKAHRYIKPYYTSYGSAPFFPTGLWRLDTIITREVDHKVEEVLRNMDFYTVS